jgi:5,10-methylenetetrahydromethanopterin reductase
VSDTLAFGIGLGQRFTLEENLRLARLAEQAGFDRVSCADNLFMRPVWPILTAAAGVTRRVEIGPLVTHPFLTHPAVIAGHVAQLDEVSGGRAFFGIGRGAFYEQVGLTTPRPITAVRESIEVVTRLLRGDRGGFRGEVFSLAEGAALRWSPVRARVPIVVGSWGPKLSELAGALADEVDVGFLLNPVHLPVVKRHMEAGAAKAGRDPSRLTLACGPLTAVEADRDAARALARQHLSVFLSVLARQPEYPSVDPDEVAAVEAALRRGSPEEAARHVSPATVDAFCLAGTPEDVVRRIEELRTLGVRHVTFCPPLGHDREAAIRLLGEAVLPRVARR